MWVGDSFTGNYRFEPGERLQDLLGAEMGAEWTVVNHARPGARTLDIFMQVDQARLFHGEPDAVILPLQVSKLMPWESPVRMDKRGDNLKWWDVDLSSPLWTSFNEEYRRKVLIHKLGLLAGFLDGIEYLYVEHVQNPLEREQMRKDAPKRQERIAKKIVAIGERGIRLRSIQLPWAKARPPGIWPL